MSIQEESLNGNGRAVDVFGTSGRVEAAMNRAIHRELRRHKLLGESIAVSQDGKVVILSPEEIPDFPEDEVTAP
jgi:hypothetical protein